MRSDSELQIITFRSEKWIGLLTPILMQLDLHSVEKVPFWYVRMSFCPDFLGNWSSSPQNNFEFSPRSI